MSKVNSAVALFKKGFNCSQAVFSTYSADLFLSTEKAKKIGCAFGGGIGCMGLTCGAVTGALMLIGLKYGNSNLEDQMSKEETYARVQEFAKRFKERNGSLQCSVLLNCDISTEEGLKAAEEKNLIEELCPKFVKDAAEIIEEIL
jgi:C_GCAxxG_C_C family probable redox protein